MLQRGDITSGREMDFNQMQMNPYGGQEMMPVEATHAQGMMDPSIMTNPYAAAPPVSTSHLAEIVNYDFA